MIPSRSTAVCAFFATIFSIAKCVPMYNPSEGAKFSLNIFNHIDQIPSSCTKGPEIPIKPWKDTNPWRKPVDPASLAGYTMEYFYIPTTKSLDRRSILSTIDEGMAPIGSYINSNSHMTEDNVDGPAGLPMIFSPSPAHEVPIIWLMIKSTIDKSGIGSLDSPAVLWMFLHELFWDTENQKDYKPRFVSVKRNGEEIGMAYLGPMLSESL